MAVSRSFIVGKLKYQFDNVMTRGGRRIFVSFIAVFILIMMTIGILRCVSFYTVPNHPKQKDVGVLRNMFVTFEQMTDPGNIELDRQASPLFKVWAVIAAAIGVVMLSCLIAIITTGMEHKIRILRKGYSNVIETDHTLILGWNDCVVDILRELVIANESKKDSCVVVVAERDKEFMDDFISVVLSDTKTTRVITRSGNPALLASLQMASIGTCKSVIVLDECDANASLAEKTISDVSVIKTILGIVAARPADTRLNIVASVYQHDHRTIVDELAHGEVTTLEPDSILAKMIVETSRSIGLSVVYHELLSFEGSEMYFYQSDWGRVTFGELAFHFNDGVPMGLLRADGKLQINPPIDVQLQADDNVLILAADDSTIEFLPVPAFVPRELDSPDRRREPQKERTLIIGWTPRVELILHEYVYFVPKGSTVDIMQRAETVDIDRQIDRIRHELSSIDINLVEGNPMTTEGLLSVRPFQYDTIIVLSQSVAGEGSERTDSATIVILLLLRNIFKAFPDEAATTKLITEVLNSHNISLVTQTGVDDFIISNHLVSRLLAQISEDRRLMEVYDELFQAEGSEIYVKPASLYLDDLPAEVTFADLIRSAQRRGEVCMGVKLKSQQYDMDRNFGVKLNPKKDTLYSLQTDDSLVVLAEDDT
ncbi:MAG: hypothetical protein IH991_01945 [Planctomycetes bacterium]|nr:hypothetical protein [Planctomycetota bacterium]